MVEFEILDSPTSRITCPISKKTIEKGQRRLTANLGTGNYPRSYDAKTFALKFKKEIQELARLTYLKCEDCGAVNDTVRSTLISGIYVDLCDSCAHTRSLKP